MKVIVEETCVPHVHYFDVVGLETLDQNILGLQVAVNDVHLVELVEPHQEHLGCLLQNGDREKLGSVHVGLQKVLAEQLRFDEEMLLVIEALVVFQQIVFVGVAVRFDKSQESDLVESLIKGLLLGREYLQTSDSLWLLQILNFDRTRKGPASQFLKYLEPPGNNVIDYDRKLPALFVPCLLPVVYHF